MKHTYIIAFFMVFCMVFPAIQVAGQNTQEEHKIDELLTPIRKKHNLPALAGAVVTTKGLHSIGAVGVR